MLHLRVVTDCFTKAMLFGKNKKMANILGMDLPVADEEYEIMKHIVCTSW